jgi:hypothetical protein
MGDLSEFCSTRFSCSSLVATSAIRGNSNPGHTASMICVMPQPLLSGSVPFSALLNKIECSLFPSGASAYTQATYATVI